MRFWNAGVRCTYDSRLTQGPAAFRPSSWPPAIVRTTPAWVKAVMGGCSPAASGYAAIARPAQGPLVTNGATADMFTTGAEGDGTTDSAGGVDAAGPEGAAEFACDHSAAVVMTAATVTTDANASPARTERLCLTLRARTPASMSGAASPSSAGPSRSRSAVRNSSSIM